MTATPEIRQQQQVSVLKSRRLFPDHLQRVLRVQLVDGDVVARLRVAEYLRAAGLEVQNAADAASALVQMQQAKPDVVVLDPAVLWSHALVARCRRDACLADVPLLLLSNEPKLSQAVQNLRARAGLAKSTDLDVLVAVVTCVAGCGALRSPHVRQGFGWAAAGSHGAEWALGAA